MVLGTALSTDLSTARRRRRLATLASAAVLAATAVFVTGTPGSAGAKGLPSILADFVHCPVKVKHVATCLFSSTTSTTFDIGSTTVTSTSPTTISFGLSYSKSGQPTVVLPVDGSQALQSPAIPLPGGLTGIPGQDSGPLEVTATPQLVGLPTANLADLLSASGPGLTLPLDVLVSTPTGILGSDCTLGDAATPMTLNLTTGTTDPPGPNTPITGAIGTFTSSDDGILTDTGMTLVDNAFAVPGAQNCGTDGALDEVLDLDKSLPSAAGSNTAILEGASYTAPASLVKRYLRQIAKKK
jgi:hypothetical protein